MATAAVEPRGRWAAAGTGSGTRFTFWPLTRPYPTVVRGYTSIYRPVAFSPDGRWLATSWSDGRIRLWPMPGTGRREPKVLQPPGTLWSRIVFDPRGRYLLAVGVGDEARIVPLDGSPAKTLPVYSGETVLFNAAVSPSGRRVATAFGYGKGERTLRVHDVETGETRVFPLPPPAAVKRLDGTPGPPGVTGYERTVQDLAFADEDTLYTAGDGGVRRWRLSSGAHERVWVPEPGVLALWVRLSADHRRALVTLFRIPGSPGECFLARLVNLADGHAQVLPSFGCTLDAERSDDGRAVVVSALDGTIRVGPFEGGTPHLLAGHEGSVSAVAVSPDRRWVASTGEDETLRLWPLPDLSSAPLASLPRDPLLARLRSLTNLRAVRDARSSTGWSIETGPFPGWKDAPDW
jgi:WD40 repeat protein